MSHPIETDATDKALLNAIQAAFPIGLRPFAALGEVVGVGEVEALQRIRRLHEAGIIRQIGAIFESRLLGYRSSLVAMEFEPGDLDDGAEVIGRHPGVSHNYARDHRYNLWFTIAVPPGKVLDEEVAALAERARPNGTRLLPTLRLFKIGVRLDLQEEGSGELTEGVEESIGLKAAKGSARIEPLPPLTDEEIAAIRALQEHLPLVPEPFAELANGRGFSAADLLDHAGRFLASGRMRRFAAVLRHRRAGFRANGMGVWAVPEDRAEAIGGQMASFKAVSHCYQRPTYPDWPYSVFTMIHGRERAEVEGVVAAIVEATGIAEWELLYSTKEYKKVRVRYFVDDDFDVATIPPRT